MYARMRTLKSPTTGWHVLEGVACGSRFRAVNHVSLHVTKSLLRVANAVREIQSTTASKPLFLRPPHIKNWATLRQEGTLKTD